MELILISAYLIGILSLGLNVLGSTVQRFDTSKRSFDDNTPKDVEENSFCKVASPVRVNTTERLHRLRQRIRYYDLDAYIVSSDDEHQSEFVANHDKRRPYITGFSGSSGTAVILREELAALWTDSRYYIQAEDELDCNWILMKDQSNGTPKLSDWIIKHVPKGHLVGADPSLVAFRTWTEWDEKFTSAGIKLLSNISNLVDEIWKTTNGREPEPNGKIVVHDLSYAGKSWRDKVTDARSSLTKKNVEALIVTDLSEIAWLFNLRGTDVPYVPVFKAYAFLTTKDITLYVKPNRLTQNAISHLESNECLQTGMVCEKVRIMNYTDMSSDVKSVLRAASYKVIISPAASFKIYSSIPKSQVLLEKSPVLEMMTVKNSVEAKGMENSMLRDSVTLVDFFALLEEGIMKGEQYDELSAAAKVEELRSKNDLWKGPSFETISAFGSNAALAHYTPQKATNKLIDKSSLYMLDSGGQYLDGTTDITRTLHFGEPTDFQKEAYTRVLQGSIDLANAVFPLGTSSTAIEVLSRQYLYFYGLNYGHGTGHGVGSYLSVHEYPPLISKPSPNANADQMKAGMFTSIEPGFYQEGDFGIRIESIFKIVEAETEYNFNNATFLKFQPVVFVPFEPKLIKTELLTKAQVKWLNSYNARTVNLVGLELRKADNERAYKWLIKKTPYISVYDSNNFATTLTLSTGPMILLVLNAIALFEQ